MQITYLIRYGTMARVGQFVSTDAELKRGETVVIRSHRGTELGEVLIPVATPSETEGYAGAVILRVADQNDLARAREVEAERGERLTLCQEVFDEGVWPIALIDVEPLLDDRRTVLHYLGPHRLDTVGILAAFRSKYDLDIMLEPVGKDVQEAEVEHEDASDGGCGSCGSDGGCGSGSCGSVGEGGSSHGGCSSCGVKGLLKKRRAPVTH
ncbi:PSP1 C-terminal domain-containing protein [Singulisphaera sp. PoT]|uniref:PSP1 C-terminal domain-containing protein n=1 Tax=Singulisphaera sp. PoT TaxID=3411797 RepID=UPI003BF51F7D